MPLNGPTKYLVPWAPNGGNPALGLLHSFVVAVRQRVINGITYIMYAWKITKTIWAKAPHTRTAYTHNILWIGSVSTDHAQLAKSSQAHTQSSTCIHVYTSHWDCIIASNVDNVTWNIAALRHSKLQPVLEDLPDIYCKRITTVLEPCVTDCMGTYVKHRACVNQTPISLS